MNEMEDYFFINFDEKKIVSHSSRMKRMKRKKIFFLNGKKN